jgi:hypothetical protein
MTSPTVKWVPRLCVTDMWAQVNGQHLTGQRSTRVGSKLGRLGSGWAGLGRAGSDTWQAMVLPRHSRGLLLGLVHKLGLRWTRALVHGGPRLLPVNRVHPSPLSLWSACTGCMCEWLVRGSLCFHLRHVPAGVVLTGVVLRRRGHPIKVGKSFPRRWRARWWCLGSNRGSLERWPR